MKAVLKEKEGYKSKQISTQRLGCIILMLMSGGGGAVTFSRAVGWLYIIYILCQLCEFVCQELWMLKKNNEEACGAFIDLKMKHLVCPQSLGWFSGWQYKFAWEGRGMTHCWYLACGTTVDIFIPWKEHLVLLDLYEGFFFLTQSVWVVLRCKWVFPHPWFTLDATF